MCIWGNQNKYKCNIFKLLFYKCFCDVSSSKHKFPKVLIHYNVYLDWKYATAFQKYHYTLWGKKTRLEKKLIQFQECLKILIWMGSAKNWKEYERNKGITKEYRSIFLHAISPNTCTPISHFFKRFFFFFFFFLKKVWQFYFHKVSVIVKKMEMWLLGEYELFEEMALWCIETSSLCIGRRLPMLVFHNFGCCEYL